MEKTYVPGLNHKTPQGAQGENGDNNMTEAHKMPGFSAAEGEEPAVVGFLYSLSRGGDPEWWPLHIGQNKIGKSADMDICLAEQSISSHHANINLKRLRRKGNALAASIIDVGSKTGIILNDEELDYDAHKLENEDIVTFGLNYKCVVILVDPTKYGLDENEEFAPANQTPKKKATIIEFAEIPEPDPFSGLEDTATAATGSKFDPNSTINTSGIDGIDLSGGGTKIL